MFVYLQLLKESIAFALNALWVNKLRTSLSVLGICIGIFAVISVMAFVGSIQRQVISSVNSLGGDLVYVQKWSWEFGDDYPWWKFLARPVPNLKESQLLERKLQQGAKVAFTAQGMKSVKLNQNSSNAMIMGITYQYDAIRNLELVNGRYFSEFETQGSNPKCILGNEIASIFFGDEDPVGKKLKIDGKNCLVIGVLAAEGDNNLVGSLNSVVLVPINFFSQMQDLNTDQVQPTIILQPEEGVVLSELVEETKGIMRSIRRLSPAADDNFSINLLSMITKQLESLFALVSVIGIIIGGFSMLVGGFGIANIMFVSVRERTSQIGIQKSLGAKNNFILTQFLSEAVVLSLLGGILGLILVFLLVTTARIVFDFPLYLTLNNILVGLTVSVIIGIIAGIVPAIRASQMDPVEAIRFAA